MVHWIGKTLSISFLILFLVNAGVAQIAPLSGKEGLGYDRALELFQKGQYGNAQRLFDKVVEDDFDNDRETRASAAYYAALSAMHLYNGDADTRVENFATTYKLSPLINRLYLEYANYRFNLKSYRQAAEYYDKVDRYRLPASRLDEFYFKKAYSLLSSDRPDEAKPLFFELKDKDSQYANSARYYYAHLLYADSNYTEALSNFLPLQGDEAFGPLVPYYLAHIYYKLNDYDKLLEVGEELIENATPSRAPEIAKLMGDAFYTKGDYPNAVKYLELYQEKGGRMGQRDHFQLGYSRYKMGLYAEAITSFNKITSGRGDDALEQNAWYHLAGCYLKTGDKQKAMTAFKAASEIKASPTIREDAFFNYAKLAYEFSDPYQDAITTLNQFMNEFPGSPHQKEVNGYLANLYVTTKDYDRALQAIERTGLQTPEMKGAYQKIAFYRANELFNSLKFAAALDRYKESLQYNLNPTVAALSHYWMGETYYRLNEYDQALSEFEAFRNSPGAFNMSEYNKSLYQSGYCHYKKFDFQKAANDFRNFTRDAKRKDPRLPDAYLRLADSYLLTGGYLVAADFYNSALKTGTTEADYAHFQRSVCLGLAGKREAKIVELKELIEKYPKSTYTEESQFEIAATYLQLEEYDKSIAALEQFMRERPQSKLVPKAYLQKGLAYSNTDRNREALAVYKDIVQKYPGTEESLEAVGLARLVYAREKRIADYLDWVETLTFVNFKKSTLDSTAFSSAFDLYSAGDCQSAISSLEDYLSRFPKGFFALKANYYLADCARRLNREAVAATAYNNILSYERNDYTNEALEFLAGKSYREKDYATALKYYGRLAGMAENKASASRAQAGMMKTAFALGDYGQAGLYADLVLGNENLDQELQLQTRRISAQAHIQKGEWGEALAKLETLIANSGGEIKAEAYYHKALVLHRQEKYQESSEVVFKLIEELPGYKEWKMRGLLLSAENYWKQEDIFQANYTLDFIVSSAYSQEITEKAKALKESIALEERNKAQRQKQQLQERSNPLMLDAGDGLMMIDQKEESTDSTQTQRP